MNSVAPSRRLSALQPPLTSPIQHEAVPPAVVTRHGRASALSVGNSSVAAPRSLPLPVAQLPFERLASAATLSARRRSPRTALRVRAAATPALRSRRGRVPPPRPTKHAHRPAVPDDVVHRQQRHVLALPSRSSLTRSSGPRLRSNGSAASSRASRCATASRSATSSPLRSTSGNVTGAGSADHLHRLAVDRLGRWCAAPHDAARSR